MTAIIIPTVIALAEAVALVILYRRYFTAVALGKALLAYMEDHGETPEIEDMDPYICAALYGEYDE